jgi:hypothetical protein
VLPISILRMRSAAGLSPSFYPPFANMVSGLHFDEPDGTATPTDVTGLIWTPQGTFETDTSQSVFGPASGYFNGSSYIASPVGTTFQYLTGDFAWMGWVRLTTTSGNQYILDHDANGGLLSYESNMLHYYNSTTGVGPLYSTGYALSLNAWHFLEVSRVAGTTYIFADGNLVASAADAHNYLPSIMRYGVYGGGGAYLNNAHLDDWSIWKGVGGHTSAYVVPTSAFPNS